MTETDPLLGIIESVLKTVKSLINMVSSEALNVLGNMEISRLKEYILGGTWPQSSPQSTLYKHGIAICRRNSFY